MHAGRRHFILSSTALAAWGGWGGLAGAQTQGGAESFRNTFGMPNYREPSAGLRFLKQAQDARTAVPRGMAAFSAFVERQPVLRQMKQSTVPEVYHLMQWNAFALDMTSLDHTTVQTGVDANGIRLPDPLFAEQIGPHRSSRALAIVHIAMFEAVNTIYRRAESYKGLQAAILADLALAADRIDPVTASVRAAIAVAAHDTLVVLYPNKRPMTELFMRKLMPLIGDRPEPIALGVRIGEAAARQTMLLRKHDPATGRFDDGSDADGAGGRLTAGPNNSLDLEPAPAMLNPTPTAVDWQADPITKVGKAIGGHWRHTEPFVLDAAHLFLPPGPPAPGSQRFDASYADVRAKGGDPNPAPLGARRKTPTTRTGTSPEDALDGGNETFVGNYWAYDGTALLCAPPRLYNMIATSVALNEHEIQEVAEMARYLALVNIVLADAGIAAWTAKYHFKLARPVTYIRQTDPAHVEAGVANRDWTPLGAPVSNGTPDGANLTPPFPSYPSGHAVFGAALFQAMRRLLPVHAEPKERFTFVSDEHNGLNRGPSGEARPLVEREFHSFAEAEQENARSRIYLGIHWQFDADDGIDQGHKIANHILDTVLKPV